MAKAEVTVSTISILGMEGDNLAKPGGADDTVGHLKRPARTKLPASDHIFWAPKSDNEEHLRKVKF